VGKATDRRVVLRPDRLPLETLREYTRYEERGVANVFEPLVAFRRIAFERFEIVERQRPIEQALLVPDEPLEKLNEVEFRVLARQHLLLVARLAQKPAEKILGRASQQAFTHRYGFKNAEWNRALQESGWSTSRHCRGGRGRRHGTRRGVGGR